MDEAKHIPPDNIFPPEVLYAAHIAREFCAGNI